MIIGVIDVMVLMVMSVQMASLQIPKCDVYVFVFLARWYIEDVISAVVKG